MHIKLALDIGDVYEYEKPDSAIWWYSSVIDTVFSETKIKQTPCRFFYYATALRYLSNVLEHIGNYPKAIAYYEISLKISEIIK